MSNAWPADAEALEALEHAFDALAALAPGARRAYIAAAPEASRDALERASALLDGEARYGRVLDAIPDLAPMPLPERIGPYRITGWIGSGGMGVVYEAQRDDAAEAVALKVVHPAFATPAAVRRFHREAELLATLDHPGIARFHDAGVVAIGHAGGLALPWIALERVRGVPIDDYARGLSLAERLALVARLCAVVQHAHERGVVHRDLKPANVLVDGAGHPKVLDFGIARALAHEVAATRLTQTGQVVGTLGFMSPEQAAGDSGAVDARADVWSLGAMLYLLASGRLPHALDGLPLAVALERVRLEEVTRLGSVDRALRGPLETIAMRALERNPDRRYTTAAALGADLERYLAGGVIHARPDGAIAQLGKLARRHRRLAIGLAGVSVGLVGLAMAATGLAWREHNLRALADSHASMARASAHEAQYLAYRASIGEAWAALEAHQGAMAARALAHAPVALRGWEWRYLTRRTDRSLSAWNAHERGVQAMACARSWVATGGDDGWVHIWTLEGRRLGSIAVREPVRGLAFARAVGESGEPPFEGATLLVQTTTALSSWRGRRASADRGERATWATDEPVQVWTIDGAANSSLGRDPISPDGARIAVGSSQGFRIEIFDAASGAAVGSIPIDVARATHASFAVDGTLQAQLEPSANGASATGFDPASGMARWKTSGEGVRLYAGSQALAKWSENRIVLEDVARRHVVIELRMANAGGAHVLVGQWIAVGEQGGAIGVWDATSGALVARLHGHLGRVVALEALGETRLVSASTDGTVRVWDLLDLDEPFTITPSTDRLFSSNATGDVGIVVAGGWGSVRAWQAVTGAPLWSRVVGRERTIACVLLDQHRAVAADRDGVLYVAGLDPEATGIVPIPPLGRDAVAARRFASVADGVFIATAERGLERITVPSGERNVVRPPSHPAVAAIAVDASGRRLAAGVGAMVEVYDTGSGCAEVARDAGGDVATVAWGPSGQLYAGLVDGTLIAWPSAGSKAARAAGAGRIAAMGASHDLRRLAVLRGDEVELWSLDGGELRELCAWRVDAATSAGWVRFSADDSRLGIGGSAGITVLSCAPVAGTSERETYRRARSHVSARRAAGLFGDEIEREAQGHPSLTPALRDAIERVSQLDGDQANYLNSNAWGRVRFPGRSVPEYALAVREAERACALWPDQPAMLNTLGLARFRRGDFAGAAIALLRGDVLRRARGGVSDPIDLAFLAAIHARLGRPFEARAGLLRAEALARERPGNDPLVSLTLMREARNLVGPN